MKRLVSMALIVVLAISMLSLTSVNAQTADFSKSAADFVSDIKIGWNLGNTFDCYVEGVSAENQETAWGNPKTTQAMIDKVASTGFNAVRIPVSWGPQVTESNGTYTVNADFITRIKQVVGWCYDNEMYVIIDMHHDDGNWLNISASDADWVTIKEKYRQIWQQVATAFKSYDEKLIFEGANEVTATTEFDGCGDSSTTKCWWGHNQIVFDRLNELYDIFADTVRETGGNNEGRYLMLPTYGGQCYSNQVTKLVIPNNDNHIIIDVHWYDYTAQQNASTRQSNAIMWKNYATSNNCAIVVGECGFEESVSSATKVAWAQSFVEDLKTNFDIPVFLWDDGGDMKMLNRTASPVNWTANSLNCINACIEAVLPGYSVTVIGDPENTPCTLSGGWGSEGLSAPLYISNSKTAKSIASVSANKAGQIQCNLSNFETLYNTAVAEGYSNIAVDIYVKFTSGTGTTIKLNAGNNAIVGDSNIIYYSNSSKVVTVSMPLSTWVPSGTQASAVKTLKLYTMSYTYGAFAGDVYLSAPYIPGYVSEEKTEDGYVIKRVFDADSYSGTTDTNNISSAALTRSYNNTSSIVDNTLSGGNKVLQVTRTGIYDPHGINYASSDIAEYAKDSVGFRVWVAAADDTTCKLSNNITIGFRITAEDGTTNYYSTDGLFGANLLGDISTNGSWHTIMWEDMKLDSTAHFNTNHNRLNPGNSSSTKVNLTSAELQNMDAIHIVFEDVGYNGSVYYIDHMQFLYED